MNKVWLAGVLAVVFAAAVTFAGVHSGGIAAPGLAFGGAKALETVHYYDVRGATLEELRQDVFSRGPYDRRKGHRFAGWAEWRIQWRFAPKEVPQGCAVDSAATETQIKYTLPRWTDAEAASPELREAWNQFADALTLHEKGHGKLARELALQIEFAIRSLPPEPTCDELGRKVDELANRMISEDESQAAYDRETGHGQTQGAAFPSSIMVRASATTSLTSNDAAESD